MGLVGYVWWLAAPADTRRMPIRRRRRRNLGFGRGESNQNHNFGVVHQGGGHDPSSVSAGRVPDRAISKDFLGVGTGFQVVAQQVGGQTRDQ